MKGGILLAAMSRRNVEIVRRIFEAWGTGDFRAGADDLDQHVVFVIRPDFPEWGVFVGPEGVRQLMRRFLEQWERFAIEAKQFQAVGDTVLVHVIQHSKGRASGIEGDLPHFMLFTFRGGKIVRMESVMHEPEALEAVGLKDNVEIVRRIWQAWEDRDTDAVFALYDPDIVWESHIHPSFGGSPLDGLYHGHEGVRQFFHEWRESFDTWEAHAETFVEAGDQVVVGYRTSGRGKASGVELKNRVWWLLYTLRDGLVTRIELFGSKPQAFEAADLSGEDAPANLS